MSIDHTAVRGEALARFASERLTRRLWGVVAMVICAIWLSLAGDRLWAHHRDPIRLLVRTTSPTKYGVTARLSGGFPWTPPQRSATEDARFFEVAATISERAKQNPSRQMRHASAIVSILTDHPDKAITTLESLTVGEGDVAAWNDLAVAQLVAASRNAEPAHLVRALAAIDAALRIDAMYGEGRFNRALILESLGLRDLAREEWQRYLRLDSRTSWANEARAHVRRLVKEEDFLDVLNREYDRLASDRAAARVFARQFRQMSRTWGETEVLGNWASAELAGDSTLAAKHLQLARSLATTLARDGGNRSFISLVQAIDQCAPPLLPTLARAHLYLRDGRRAFRAHKIDEAARLYATAAEEFGHVGSPGGLRARSYAANMLFESGRLDEGLRAQRRLLAIAPSDFPAYRAETLWMIGTIECARASFGPCIDAWTASLRLFETLGESNYAATVRGQMVFAFDRLGDPRRAWRNRMLMLREHGRRITSQQVEALGSASRAAMMDEDWEAALSLLDLQVVIGRRLSTPRLLTQSLLYRAEAYRAVNRNAEAVADIASARRMMPLIEDAQYRGFMEAFAKGVASSLTSDPRRAASMLTEAIDFQSTRGRRMFVPDLLRKRGRAFVTMGDHDRAATDFETGVAELERHRESLSPGEDRWGVFHAAESLFGEAIALALARGKVQTAFDYAERARARALLDSLGTPWRRVTPSDMPADTALVEYAVHGKTLYTFVVDARRIHAVARPIDGDLTAKIAAFVDAGTAAETARFESGGRELYDVLIAPIEREIEGKQRLAVVTDSRLGTLPFSALRDHAGRHLIERYALLTEPSAAFFARARSPQRSRPVSARSRILVVEGSGGPTALWAAEREARDVCRLYSRATLLARDSATSLAFTRAALDADAIHFAGHAVASTSDGRRGYLLLSGRSSDEEHFDLQQIASLRLSRTSLVVLAACGTAEGEIRGTEGTISVARAFLAAGVPTVVATLWSIDDDAAAKFFPVLHRHLARGVSPSDALRATQIEWIHKGRDNPALWAAVQVLGQ